jgi:GNAT superfamily N-acetyltransferase
MQPINKKFETLQGLINIREALPSDVIQYRELRLSTLQDSPTAFSADYQANLNHPMSFWEGRLSFDENGIIFFAVYENNLIGITGIRRGESPKTKHSAGIWGVYVRSEWRGLHIAEMLIETCIAWAKPRQVNIVKLGVTSTNASALRCYERCSFTIYGNEPRAMLYGSTYYDEYLMSRDVG